MMNLRHAQQRCLLKRKKKWNSDETIHALVVVEKNTSSAVCGRKKHHQRRIFCGIKYAKQLKGCLKNYWNSRKTIGVRTLYWKHGEISRYGAKRISLRTRHTCSYLCPGSFLTGTRIIQSPIPAIHAKKQPEKHFSISMASNLIRSWNAILNNAA